jgi:hypothetical protein
MLTWQPKHWWNVKASDPRGALLLTLWFVMPGPVRFYEHGVRFIDVRCLGDTFVPWEQLEGYCLEETAVCLLEKTALYQGAAQIRCIRIPAAKRKKVIALLSAYLG